MQEKNTLMGVLSYLGPLVIIPLVTVKDDAFVKYHVRQGLVLLVIEAVVYVLQTFFWFGYGAWQLYSLINLAAFILSIIGIINVVQGHEKELPVVGQFAKNFKV